MTADELVATRPVHARALAHPTRHRLLVELAGSAATISQLAHRMTTNKGNVAHHLGVLEAAGLVRKDRTRTVRGGTEQYFVRSARRIRFAHGPDGAAITALMETLTQDLARDPQALLNYRVLRLTARQATALTAHLDAVVNDLTPAAEREPAFGVVVGVYRRTPRRAGEAPAAGGRTTQSPVGDEAE